MKIAFIGGGNMGRAMINAIIRQELAVPEDITVADPRQESREALAVELGVTATESNVAAALSSDVVILAVKPQHLDEVMAGLSGQLCCDHLVISIIAGKKLSAIVDGLRHEAVIRVMPNTPAQIGLGMSVWTATDSVDVAQKETARRILTAMGDELYTPDEADLDKATAISGSGPAYFFLFMEALVDAAVKLGLSPEAARQMVIQTAVGSAEFAHQSEHELGELRRMVTSPGGTTAEALKIFDSRQFRETIDIAVKAAFDRAQELGAPN
ncbi:pyrroline-5-carboxylate reductase [Dehalogenimonas sp. THU2]|uniref:pyrroline-5-carboxylate reductase n=1 Tax=Dehalogenimonas sp. THU2 TaxID=3151121 RepID=UPI003218C6A5